MLRSILRMEKMAAIHHVFHQQGLLMGTVWSHVLATLQGAKKEEHNIDMVNGMDITDSEDMFDEDEQGSDADKDRQHQDIGMDRQPAEGNHKELVGVSDVKLATCICTFFKFSEVQGQRLIAI